LTLDTTRLRQIFQQEKKCGYCDKSVFGGLDLFLANWLGQASAQITQPARFKALRKLCPPGFRYAALTPVERERWIETLLSIVSLPEEPPPPAGKPAQPRKKNAKTAGAAPSGPAGALTPVDSPVNSIKGIAGALSERFARLGVRTIRDLLYYFPSRHLDYSRLLKVSGLIEGKDQTIIANVWEVRPTMPGGRRSTEATLGDESGNIRAVWFNNPYVARQMKAGDRIVVSGRVKAFAGRLVYESPEWELADDRDLVHTGRLVPLYPLTSGLHQRSVRKLIKNVVEEWAGRLPEFMPAAIKERLGLLGLTEAISQAHFPDDAQLKESARARLAFDELMLLQLGVMTKKRKWQTEQPGVPFKIDNRLLERFIGALPFTLTAAQKRVSAEIMADLGKPVAMSRLLQGEVGSGKTVVALEALLMAIANGFQGALMAPTEILAAQHFKSICRMLEAVGTAGQRDESSCTFSGITPKPVTVALLISDVKGASKRALKDRLSAGEIGIIIGTHALIEKEVRFARLGLVVIDEQHRFGVEQRSALRQKGFNPHMLVMTATPIPRTLALTLYGDLDLSVIDELPPGRQEIKTKWFSPAQRDSAYRFLRKQVSEGHQGFIICPLVEESDSVQAKAAVAEFTRLSSQVYPDLRLALLHGRMAAAEKESVMKAFNQHETDILVSTAVVEVGIDVPNATVMMIESADRFGLSQLHQFRGRVGRGAAQSYCMLMTENPSDIAKLRLDIIETTQDGFKLADEDLKLRGPGEFFGTRQSGLPDLRMAKLSDTSLLELARSETVKLMETDPGLKQPANAALAKELLRVWGLKNGEWS
jgi:ATP-dependent DNA helicase RecG